MERGREGDGDGDGEGERERAERAPFVLFSGHYLCFRSQLAHVHGIMQTTD